MQTAFEWPTTCTIWDQYQRWRSTEHGQRVIAAVTHEAVRQYHIGRRRISVKRIIENLRDSYTFTPGLDADGLKINNTYAAPIAHDLRLKYPFLRDKIRTRNSEREAGK